MSTAVEVPNANDLLGEFLTESQLGQLLRRNVRTLRRWNASRQGPPRIVVGRTILYKKSSVVEWLTAHERRAKRDKWAPSTATTAAVRSIWWKAATATANATATNNPERAGLKCSLPPVSAAVTRNVAWQPSKNDKPYLCNPERANNGQRTDLTQFCNPTKIYNVRLNDCRAASEVRSTSAL